MQQMETLIRLPNSFFQTHYPKGIKMSTDKSINTNLVNKYDQKRKHETV